MPACDGIAFTDAGFCIQLTVEAKTVIGAAITALDIFYSIAADEYNLLELSGITATRI